MDPSRAWRAFVARGHHRGSYLHRCLTNTPPGSRRQLKVLAWLPNDLADDDGSTQSAPCVRTSDAVESLVGPTLRHALVARTSVCDTNASIGQLFALFMCPVAETQFQLACLPCVLLRRATGAYLRSFLGMVEVCGREVRVVVWWCGVEAMRRRLREAVSGRVGGCGCADGWVVWCG